MTGVRGDCSVCDGAYALRADGALRVHRFADGSRCDGSGLPSRNANAVVMALVAPVVRECVAPGWDHEWSGWTRLPFSTCDFRRCLWCEHVELQERQPCALCGEWSDARALEIPDYGVAYICGPCVAEAAV